MRYEEGEKLLYVYSKIYTRTGTDSIILYIYIYSCVYHIERERETERCFTFRGHIPTFGSRCRTATGKSLGDI